MRTDQIRGVALDGHIMARADQAHEAPRRVTAVFHADQAPTLADALALVHAAGYHTSHIRPPLEWELQPPPGALTAHLVRYDGFSKPVVVPWPPPPQIELAVQDQSVLDQMMGSGPANVTRLRFCRHQRTAWDEFQYREV